MRLTATTIIVFLLSNSIAIFGLHNPLSAQDFTRVQNPDKYSTQFAVQDHRSQHTFDTPPKIVGGFQALQDKIIYPEEAKQQNIEGRVIVEIFITAQGEVTSASVVEGFEKGGLNEAALKAVKKISFSPALQNEKPVSVRVQLPIQFKLNSKSDTGSVIYLNMLDENFISVNGDTMDYECATHTLKTWANGQDNPIISLRAHIEVTQESISRLHNYLTQADEIPGRE